MKFEEPVNANYVATVVEIHSITPLDNCDNVVGTPIFGYQAIVGKDTKVGDIGIVFTAETKLSQEFARVNNLHRHSDLNVDQGIQGYLEDNRRVKAMKFRGHRSDALFMPLESLSFTGINPSELKVGDTFDKLNGFEICRKHVVKEPGALRTDKNANVKFKRVDEKFLPEHYDTENYWKNADHIPADAQVVVTQKLHGTSVRIGNTIVKRSLKWYEKLAAKLGVKVPTTEYAHVYGSRKVIKDPNNPNQNHYYSTDLWGEVGARFDALVPEGFILYGEVIGWTTDGSPIQKGYTYDLPQGENELYVYRVAVVTPQGRLVELSWAQVKAFCAENGIKYTPEFFVGRHGDFTANNWIDVRFRDEGLTQAVPLSDRKTVDEGVVVRYDGGWAPYLLKAKSPIFLGYETKMLDEEALDLEAEGSEVAA